MFALVAPGIHELLYPVRMKPVMSSGRMARMFLWAVLCPLVLYVCIYVALSSFGRYEPFPLGVTGTKANVHAWAPCGFYIGDFRWRKFMTYAFRPLWLADNECWHTGHGTK